MKSVVTFSYEKSSAFVRTSLILPKAKSSQYMMAANLLHALSLHCTTPLPKVHDLKIRGLSPATTGVVHIKKMTITSVTVEGDAGKAVAVRF
jgi:hypothetical protein